MTVSEKAPTFGVTQGCKHWSATLRNACCGYGTWCMVRILRGMECRNAGFVSAYEYRFCHGIPHHEPERCLTDCPVAMPGGIYCTDTLIAGLSGGMTCMDTKVRVGRGYISACDTAMYRDIEANVYITEYADIS